MQDRMIYQVDETRDKILSEAEQLFREKGFFETQMKDVAAKTGMSRNTLYRYFRDKNDLAVKVIERKLNDHGEKSQERLTAALKESNKTGLEKLEIVIRTVWLESEQTLDSKLMAEFDAYYSGERISKELQGEFLMLDTQRSIDPIIEIIDEGKADGSIRSDLDSHLTYVTIINALRALKQRIILRGDVLVETIQGETEQMPALLLDMIFRGIKGEK